jgi:gluconate 2-dehydrogenase gamma chain
MSDLSRREFFLQSGLYGGSLWLMLAARPRTIRAAQDSTHRAVLTEAQWKTVEAVTGRIIPTDEDPGAIEARCVNFVDKALAHEDAKLKPLYQRGLAGLDLVAKRAFEKPFVELGPEQQDDLLAAIESGKADGWPSGGVAAPEFFAVIRMHTIVGFLADPKYGGNRDYAGWKVAGYPGGGHHLGGYSPAQMIGKDKVKTVWGDEV